MTGMRSHTDHQSRRDWWRGQIQRQPKTKLTIADFCRQLGVSVPTFDDWKRRVAADPEHFLTDRRDEAEAAAIPRRRRRERRRANAPEHSRSP